MTPFENYMLVWAGGVATSAVIYAVYPHVERAIRQFRMAAAKVNRVAAEATMTEPNPLMADPVYRALSEGKRLHDPKTGQFIKGTKSDRLHALLAGGQ